ncbi:DUF1653 domain-containing protein [Paenibacillus sp. ISL-20]|uniref:DUF1653 domain-containing protein n=1 Tax=Paenibacillus sp. ISL-20 TaxID=2819163 RepID=UPI001BEC604D|nr:DUF1653 domain-containing protein [Paenibacillus sp. ISL-20]MBT2759955.1 DUF1653 domain-containing protein [Paenibacillus sp. ISL-20]
MDLIYEVTKGDKYRHYKGGLYKIVSLATHTETQEGLVIYEDENRNRWARPIEMFFGYLEDGTRRFEPYQEENSDWGNTDPFEYI